MHRNIPKKEIYEIIGVLITALGVYVLKHGNKIAVSSSSSMHDVLFDETLTSMDWSYFEYRVSIVEVLDWLSRGIVLYRLVQGNNPELCHAEEYAKIPRFECLSELKMKLNLRGIV